MTYFTKLVTQIKNNGGLSLDLVTDTAPNSGYMVSMPKTERRIPLALFNEESLSSFVNYHAKDIYKLGAMLGAWIEKDTVFLDLSVNIPDYDTARLLGIKYKQLAIYDIANAETIYL